MVGEDQAEVITQRAGERGRLRNVERIREARIEEDGRSAASRVLEVGADAVVGIGRVRRGALLQFSRTTGSGAPSDSQVDAKICQVVGVSGTVPRAVRSR